MTDPSHPEGQSPVQPMSAPAARTTPDHNCRELGCAYPEQCRDAREELISAGFTLEAPEAMIARLRAELAQQKQFGLDRLAQHVEEEQAAHAENATLRAQLSEKEAEIARLTAPMGGYGVQSGPPLEFYPRVVASLESQLAALRVERDGLRTSVLLDAIERNQELLSIIERRCDVRDPVLVNVHSLMNMNAIALKNGGRIQ